MLDPIPFVNQPSRFKKGLILHAKDLIRLDAGWKVIDFVVL